MTDEPDLTTLSTDELISRALASLKNEEEQNEAVMVLHFRGSREVFDAARALLDSPEPIRRILAVHILAQIGIPERTFRDETAELLLNLLETEKDHGVLAAVAEANGASLLGSERLIAPLIKLAGHPNSEVRFGVTLGLSGFESDEAIAALIGLSADSEPDVRDWATFALGSMTEKDTPEIREALMQRLSDENDDARAEALMGLAIRNDPRVVEPIFKELTAETVGALAVKAAAIIAHPSLLQPLKALEAWWDVDEKLLQGAIERCRLASLTFLESTPSESPEPETHPPPQS